MPHTSIALITQRERVQTRRVRSVIRQFDAQDRLARGETDAAIAYVALFKALGGRWR